MSVVGRRNAKNAENCSSEASDEQKIEKNGYPRPRMNEKQEKLLVRGLG